MFQLFAKRKSERVKEKLKLKENIADLLTKGLNKKLVGKFSKGMGLKQNKE